MHNTVIDGVQVSIMETGNSNPALEKEDEELMAYLKSVSEGEAKLTENSSISNVQITDGPIYAPIEVTDPSKNWTTVGYKDGSWYENNYSSV